MLPIMETERLRLRPFTLADAEIVQALAGAPEVAATTLHITHPYPDGAAAAWINTHESAAERGDSYTWAIARRPDGALLGAVSLSINKAHNWAEMGYWLGLPFWNQGYTSEAARRVVAFGFSELGLHRILATCFPRNPASARVMEKAGLRYEGHLRGHVRKGEVSEDILMYGRLRSDVD